MPSVLSVTQVRRAKGAETYARIEDLVNLKEGECIAFAFDGSKVAVVVCKIENGQYAVMGKRYEQV